MRPQRRSIGPSQKILPESETPSMVTEAPETEEVTTRRVACDGGEGALGHPRVWLAIGDDGFVECPYCDKKFVLKPGAADH